MKKENFEIIFFGRGGQGAKTCAQIIAESAMLSGNEIQGFPEYGPERRGAPVRAFVRISNKKIRIHEPVTNPDIVLVIDYKLFETMPELKNYNCPIIINTHKEKSYFKNLKSKELYTIDGSAIALEEIKIDNPNIVLIGSLLKYLKNNNLEKLVGYQDVKKSIEIQFEKKGKRQIIEPNLNCLKKGFEKI